MTMTVEDKQAAETSVLEQATNWYYRLQEADIPEDHVINWQNWLSEDESHLQAFEKIEEIMQLSSQANQADWPADAELSIDSYDAELPIAAWQKQQPVLETDQQHRFFWRDWLVLNRPPAWAVAGVSFAFVVALTLGFLFNWAPAINNELNVALHETQAAEHRDVTLADGSRITLGAKSLISVTYSDKQRRVLLERGEVFFDVAKDPRRPFIAVSGNRIITAVGTAFNVARHSDRIVVTVTEGTVVVEQDVETNPVIKTSNAKTEKHEPDSAAILKAGQQLAYSKDEVAEVVTTDTEVVTAWRDGRLKYLGEKLRYVIADVNRYSDKPIRIGDAVAADIQFTGTVFQDNIDTWLESIAEVFPVSVSKMADGEVILMSRVSN